MGTVVGHHGTTAESAEKLASRDFRPLSDRKPKWLGSGLYFFENNLGLADTYARAKARNERSRPAIFWAEIDITDCLDVTIYEGQLRLRRAHAVLKARAEKSGIPLKTQAPFEMLDGEVRTGRVDEWMGGLNRLDHQVINEAIDLGRKQEGVTFDVVRGIFIESGPIYPTSFIFEAAYVALCVRDPARRILECGWMPVS
jgi:hypothetical protein